MNKETALALVATSKLTEKELLKLHENFIDQEFCETIIRTKKISVKNLLILSKKFPKSENIRTAIAESINLENLKPKQMIAIAHKLSDNKDEEDKQVIWKTIDKKIDWDKLPLSTLLDVEKKYNLPESVWKTIIKKE